MPEVPRAAKQRPVRLEPEAACSTCRQPVALSGPFLRIKCEECGEAVELSSTIWSQLLRDVDEKSWELPETSDERKNEQLIGRMKLSARWRAQPPTCQKCAAILSLVEPGTDDTMQCSACNTALSTFPAPAWLRTELPTAMQLYGAAREPNGQRAGKRGFWLTFQGTPPTISAQHRSAIEAAIGPGPASRPPVSLAGPVSSRGAPPPQKKKGVRWEWIALGVFTVLIAGAVRVCASRMSTGDVPTIDDTKVEPVK